MLRRYGFLVAVILGAGIIFAQDSYAMRLYTKEAALKAIFGEGTEITTETKALTEPVLSRVKERLGGCLILKQQGCQGSNLTEESKIDFYFGTKDGNKIIAIIDSEPGRWGPVQFIVAMDIQGVVTKVEVMEYSEKRGQPISRQSFMSQYRGKSGKSALEVGKDITGISGATISARAATFAVKKAVVLYEEIYLNK